MWSTTFYRLGLEVCEYLLDIIIALSFFWIVVLFCVIRYNYDNLSVKQELILYGFIVFPPFPLMFLFSVSVFLSWFPRYSSKLFDPFLSPSIIISPIFLIAVMIIPLMFIEEIPIKRIFDIRFDLICSAAIFYVWMYRFDILFMFLRGNGWTHSRAGQARWDGFCERVKAYGYADIEGDRWLDVGDGEYQFYYRDHVELVDGRNRRRRQSKPTWFLWLRSFWDRR
ncbi:hypothetical protein Cocul_00383 [Corynebacterium oculi]|uniref:Uncharacterized protein n=1 Tax=Corynebacterium oculi TaxID=1544416 RepID=A0A0Q1DYC0_9CORY|nr:hypothetical protein Cocul_00383 [Corynebacterium oculi]